MRKASGEAGEKVKVGGSSDPTKQKTRWAGKGSAGSAPYRSLAPALVAWACRWDSVRAQGPWVWLILSLGATGTTDRHMFF